MPRLEELYLSRETLPELSREFFQYYDDDYWYAKLEMYEYLLDHVTDVFGDAEGVGEDDLEHYRRYLRSEIHYLFFHSTEALLGLVRSITRGGIPWIDLKETRTHILDRFVENELQNDEFVDQIGDVFYPGGELEDPEEAGVIEDSVSFIHRYLQRIGGLFGSRAVYNEYKHGLRLVVSSAEITMEFDRDPEDIDESWLEDDRVDVTEEGIRWVGMDDDILYYLEPQVIHQDEDTGEKYWSLARRQKAMEFDLYRRLCSVNSMLIELIFQVRRIQLDIDTDERRRTNVTVFGEGDLDEVFEYENEMTSFTVNEYFPTDDEDIRIYEVPR